MRLFVALEIPAPLRSELERRARALAGELPKARWVRPEAMHLTLSFLGETHPQVLPELHHELTGAFAEAAPLALCLREVGAFPPRGKPRVLWTGLVGADRSPSEDLAALRSAVARAVQRAASVEPEKRRFHPHLTLARCSPTWRRDAFERFRDAFGEPPADVFTIEEGVLFESDLRPSGARYRTMRAYPLGKAGPPGETE